MRFIDNSGIFYCLNEFVISGYSQPSLASLEGKDGGLIHLVVLTWAVRSETLLATESAEDARLFLETLSAFFASSSGALLDARQNETLERIYLESVVQQKRRAKIAGSQRGGDLADDSSQMETESVNWFE